MKAFQEHPRVVRKQAPGRAVPFDAAAIRKILVVKPSALGDVIHSLPFLKAMHGRFPQAQIHWVIARGLHTLLEKHSMIHRLWIMDKDAWKKPKNLGRTLTTLRELFKALRSERFDLVVDLQGLLRSGIISLAAGCPVRVGFQEGREGSHLFYTHRVRGFADSSDIHAVDRYLKVARFLGCDPEPEVEFPLPPFMLPAEKKEELQLPQKYIVIAPAAGGGAKKWPPQRFGQLAARLPCPSVVVAGPSDEHIGREVAACSQGSAMSIAGKTNLLELAAVIQGAEFMICNDTGPMHLAAAMKVPVFALFGPTNPLRTGPYGSGHTVIRKDVSCSPCYRRSACSTLECMENLTADEVYGIITEKSDPLGIQSL